MIVLNLLKGIFHNIGVIILGSGFAFLGRKLDFLLGLTDFESVIATTIACLLLTIGFLIRAWATYLFCERQMKVISLKPQKKLITSGPYRFLRNPRYLGGNLFIFLGAVLFLGSPTGVVLTVINLFLADLFVR